MGERLEYARGLAVYYEAVYDLMYNVGTQCICENICACTTSFLVFFFIRRFIIP